MFEADGLFLEFKDFERVTTDVLVLCRQRNAGREVAGIQGCGIADKPSSSGRSRLLPIPAWRAAAFACVR